MPPAIRLRRALLALAAIVIACSGGKDSVGPTPGATLAVSPGTLSLADTATTRTLYLTTAPSGGRLSWRVTGAPAWLVVEPSQGTIDGRVVEVKVRADTLAKMEPATLNGRIDIVSDGGAAGVDVTAIVSPNPIPELSVAALTVPGTSDSASFTIRNTGRGTLTWQLATSAGLTATPASGYTAAGQSVSVRVTANKAVLPIGTSNASIIVRSNARGGEVVLPVAVVVAPSPKIALSSGRLGYPAGVTARTVVLRNTGRGALAWSIGQKESWISVMPQSGTVAAGDSTTLGITVNRAVLPSGGTGTVSITSDAVNGAAAVAVEVSTDAPIGPGLRVLDHRVVDAEFSAASGLIVTVSANPNRLNAIDAETGAMWSVPLPLPATTVGLRPDGALAAVGHDGYVTLVNLVTRTVVKSYPVTTNVLDVVLPSNGWVYAFPRTDQWESIRGIELATGKETNSDGYSIYAGTLARLHPSGDFIYGANNGLSPSDFEKYDIRQGRAKVLYDSPYHGDYSFGGNLWISEDGTRLFARSGNVFRSSPVQAEDMRYAGKLAGLNVVRWAGDSRARGRVYVLGGTGDYWDSTDAGLRVYDAAFLTYLGTVPLPAMPAGSGTATVTGHWVFPSPDGSKLYVLAQAVASAGLQLDWALIVVDTAGTP